MIRLGTCNPARELAARHSRDLTADWRGWPRVIWLLAGDGSAAVRATAIR